MAFSWNDLPYDVLEGICTATAIHPPDTASSPHDYDSDSGSSSRSTDFNLNDKSWHETLLALSSVDSRTRETCLPLLFTKLRFRKTCVESSPSWESYDELMLLLLGNNALCRTVRVFELSSWISRENKERHLPTTTTYERIPEFIASLPRLHTLVFQLKDHLVPGFTSTFAKLTETRGPLKTVETLSITPSCHFIIGHCPNIRRFEERTWYQDGDVEFTTWMKALGTSCASLRALSTRVEISLTMFQDILDYTPWLETLHLLRERNWWSSGIRSEDDDMQESILVWTPLLFPSVSLLSCLVSSSNFFRV
ncbi:hypothetical protein JAAARDRAFT_43058 [Jaapia argillacea MUCL 33604]|uniref:F-box domain-containing protein n=1 Tax=Jaapia argillacea MUCL 33604 TaxID=933084 RepID=A0A067PFB3_9AGAM|nr:hypothetical protein JAAARDRAFT_43058 [Jaapia argillacea MUCL 33604]